MLEIVADKLIVDGVEVATIAATQRKTENFQGEAANLETIVMINGEGIVINTPIEPAKVTPAPKTKAEKADA
ncbi:MAG: hypothetical protein ACRC62_07925 [Microcoleus sp.]